jgi:protein-tyrosine phosphatase
MGGVNYNELIVENAREEDFGDHLERRLKLRDSHCSREVLQLHYTAWPSRGVPTDLERVNRFVTKVQQRRHNKAPLLVHCRLVDHKKGPFLLFTCLPKNYIEILVNQKNSKNDMDK